MAQTRSFRADPATVVVSASSDRIVAAVEELFVDLDAGSPDDQTAELSIIEVSDQLFEIRVDGERRSSTSNLGSTLGAVVSAVSRIALDADPDRLHLHCAALASGPHGVLISAESGTGKTTLAGALAERGWQYLSDEAVAFELKSHHVSGFAKPLVLKPGGLQLLPNLRDRQLAATDLDLAGWAFLAAGSIASGLIDSLEPTTVVLLQRTPDGLTSAPPQTIVLHPADAVVSLMSQTMDSSRYGPDALATLAAAASRATCIALSVGPIDEMCSTLNAIVDRPVVTMATSELHPAGAELANPTWQVPDTVRSVLIGDRVVVHDSESAAIAALDEAGSGLWQVLLGLPVTWMPADAIVGAQVEVFFEQLATLGFLSRRTTTEPVDLS